MPPGAQARTARTEAGGFSGGRRGVGVENERRELDQRGSGLAAIAFQRSAVRHGIVVEVEDTRLEIIVERLLRQAMRADRGNQRFRQWMALPRFVGDGITPPLQANFAGQRLADAVADRSDFGIEGVERK